MQENFSSPPFVWKARSSTNFVTKTKCRSADDAAFDLRYFTFHLLIAAVVLLRLNDSFQFEKQDSVIQSNSFSFSSLQNRVLEQFEKNLREGKNCAVREMEIHHLRVSSNLLCHWTYPYSVTVHVMIGLQEVYNLHTEVLWVGNGFWILLRGRYCEGQVTTTDMSSRSFLCNANAAAAMISSAEQFAPHVFRNTLQRQHDILLG